MTKKFPTLIPPLDEGPSFQDTYLKPFERQHYGLINRIKTGSLKFDDGVMLERLARESEENNLAISLYMLKYSIPNTTPYKEAKDRVDGFLSQLYEIREDNPPKQDHSRIVDGILDFMYGNKREIKRLSQQIKGWEMGTLEALHLDEHLRGTYSKPDHEI